MNLAILGSGVYLPTKTRGPSGYWLEAGSLKILMDCGSGTLQRLTKADKDYFEVDVIVISHLHPDHTSDLAAFLHPIYHNYQKRRKKPLKIIGGKGFKKWYQGLVPYYGWPKSGQRQLQVFELARQKKIHGISFKFARGNHLESSIWTEITHKNKSLVYTGDTTLDDNLIEFSKRADLLLTECSVPKGGFAPTHMTTTNCGQLAAQARVKKVVLTHLGPEVLKSPIKKDVGKYYKGPVVVAKDLMEIKI